MAEERTHTYIHAPNQRLAALLAETGWTGTRLAQAVNAAGAEAGVDLRYERPAVAHWLAGMRPRPPVPALVAEVLTRALGRPVTAAQAGLAPAGASAASGATHDEPGHEDGSAWWRRVDATDALRQLGRAAGPARTGTRSRGVFHLAALTVPPWAVLAATRPARPAGPPQRRADAAELVGARAMLALLADVDAAHGGGSVLAVLQPYLGTVIAPWLKAGAPAAARRELLLVAARLAYLAGFACFDQCDQPAAQRYHLASAALSAEAGDRAGHAVTLRGLSLQARWLGHRSQAVCLAQAAVDTAARRAPAQTRACLHGQLAIAQAADGNQPGARESLACAWAELQRVREPPRAIGGWHEADAAYADAAVLAYGGDRPGAITALQHSLRRRPEAERRSRAITAARLAELQLDLGHLEAACTTWQIFLEEYPHLRSARVDRALAIARARIRPHQNNPTAAALLRRIQTLSLSASSAHQGSGCAAWAVF